MVREQVSSSLMQASRSISHQGLGSRGKLFKYDISIKLDLVVDFIDMIKNRISSAGYRVRGLEHNQTKPVLLESFEFVLCSFGHAGDQNIHLNILLTPIESQIFNGKPLSDEIIGDIYKLLDDIVYSEVIHREGNPLEDKIICMCHLIAMI
jgi:FAD/FMN-containing dehydrogenase